MYFKSFIRCHYYTFCR